MLQRKRADERIARERVLFKRHPGGDIAACIIYPNTYPLAMANLGFQAIYRIFDAAPQVAADRAFLPDREDRQEMEARSEMLLSFEQGRALSDFDILVTISICSRFSTWPAFPLPERSAATATIP